MNANEQSDEYDGAAAFAAPPNRILSPLSSEGDGLGQDLVTHAQTSA
jgi:hypothetical protein